MGFLEASTSIPHPARVCRQSHTRRQPLTRCRALIHPKALTHEGNHKLRMSPHLTQHAEVSTHRHTRVPRTAAHPGQACALTDSQTHGHMCGHPACAMPDTRTHRAWPALPTPPKPVPSRPMSASCAPTLMRVHTQLTPPAVSPSPHPRRLAGGVTHSSLRIST